VNYINTSKQFPRYDLLYVGREGILMYFRLFRESFVVVPDYSNAKIVTKRGIYVMELNVQMYVSLALYST
jgi:hypothetical protein